MRLPLSLSIAFAYLWNRRRPTLISISGVAMGVGFFIAVSGMMQGLQSFFINQIVDIAPHILMKDEFRTAPRQPVQVTYPGATIELMGLKPKEELRGIRGGDRTVAELRRIPGLSVAPTLRGQVFLRYGSKDVSASLIGIEPNAEKTVSNIEKDLIAGSLSALQTNSNGIILGTGLAQNLGARMGSKLSVVSPKGEILVMKVVGITRTGITPMDYTEAYALLKKSQILQERPNRINQIKMRLTDINDAAVMAGHIEARYGYRTEGWQETNENVFSLFRVQNMIMYSVVTAILIVAGFGIFNVISTVVNEKTKDIAILKSMGFGKRDIERTFLAQGIIVGLLGTLLGWAIGATLAHLLSHVPFNMGDKGFIVVNHLIIRQSPAQYGIAGILAVAASALSALVPARRAARLNPVEIIRGAT